MIVLGASRHSKEVLQILRESNKEITFLFDDVSKSFSSYFKSYNIIKDIKDDRLKSISCFYLALGGTSVREILYNKFMNIGLAPVSVIGKTAVIGTKEVQLGNALNIMHFTFIADNVKIGDGTLINAYASIHHDVILGKFTEIAPKATILGGATIGDFTSIGAGAIILPDINVASNCIIGAGSVVTKDIGENEIWYGVPAKFIKNRE
jgi:sugar O-acyltransferase (sialic acid O-acetyltransferase NeuD family)